MGPRWTHFPSKKKKKTWSTKTLNDLKHILKQTCFFFIMNPLTPTFLDHVFFLFFPLRRLAGWVQTLNGKLHYFFLNETFPNGEKNKKRRKMIYVPRNQFCMIWVIFRSASSSINSTIKSFCPSFIPSFTKKFENC